MRERSFIRRLVRGLQLRLPLNRFRCARGACEEGWIMGVPEVSFHSGGIWRHYHYECAP